jgi:hypothetical protein
MTATATPAADPQAAALLGAAAALDQQAAPPEIDPATGQPPAPVDYAGEAGMLIGFAVTTAATFWPSVKEVWTDANQKAVAAAAAPVMEKYGFTLGDFMGAYKEEIGLLFVAGPLILKTIDAVEKDKRAALDAKRRPASSPTETPSGEHLPL